jgi:hypothetical protein
MKSQQSLMTRRALVGAAVAMAVLPRPGLDQATPNAATRGGEASMRLRCAFSDQTFTATLHDNPSARDLASMLPLELGIEDYSTNEKIAYLPRRLTEDGSGPFANEAPGDLCYYAPWGNLVFFYAAYRYSRGLIRLGRLDGGVQPLLRKGKFPLRIELLS